MRPPGERVFTEQEPLRPMSGEGIEVGAKFDLFNDRISGAFSVFRTELVGVPKSFSFAVPGAIDASGNQQTALIGNQNNGRLIKGFETELFLRPLESWQIVLTYTYLDSEEILNQTVADIRQGNNIPVSIPSLSVPDHQVGVWSKYTFSEGTLSGLAIGGGFNWSGERYGAYALRTENPAASSFVGANDAVEREILLGSQILWDAMVSYAFTTGRYRHSLQLNVRNITNRQYFHPGGMPQDPRMFFLTLRSSF